MDSKDWEELMGHKKNIAELADHEVSHATFIHATNTECFLWIKHDVKHWEGNETHMLPALEESDIKKQIQQTDNYDWDYE